MAIVAELAEKSLLIPRVAMALTVAVLSLVKTHQKWTVLLHIMDEKLLKISLLQDTLRDVLFKLRMLLA